MVIKQKSIYVVMIAILFVACREEKKSIATTDIEVPVVDITAVKSLQPSIRIVLPGELKPWNRSNLFPKVKGYVSNLLVDRGSLVKKGQLLAELEAPELMASLNHARAQVSAAEAAWIEQKAKLKATAATYRRITEINKTPGAVSANELDLAYAKMITDSALVRAAAENFHAAEAQLTSQSQLVSYLSIRAPFDGNITERNVSPGELVGPETNQKPLFIIEDRSKLRLTVAIPENLSNSVGKKCAVTFTTQAEPLTEYEAVFARSANTVQENNRTMLSEFDFENRHESLKAGMYAEVKLPVTRSRPTFFVPNSAVLQSTEGVFVIRVNNNVAEWVSIQKGNSADSLVEIFGRIQEGDRIVKKAHDELRNGQAVKAKVL